MPSSFAQATAAAQIPKPPSPMARTRRFLRRYRGSLLFLVAPCILAVLTAREVSSRAVASAQDTGPAVVHAADRFGAQPLALAPTAPQP